jgi:hypothetical protein
MLCPNLAGRLFKLIPALVFSVYLGNDFQQAIGTDNGVAIDLGGAFSTFTRHFSNLFWVSLQGNPLNGHSIT